MEHCSTTAQRPQPLVTSLVGQWPPTHVLMAMSWWEGRKGHVCLLERGQELSHSAKVLDSLITCNGCCILPEWYCIIFDVPSCSSCYSHGDWPAWLGLCHHCHHHPGGGGPGGGSGRLPPLETSPQRWALYSWCVVIGIASVTNFTPLTGKCSFSKANTSR